MRRDGTKGNPEGSHCGDMGSEFAGILASAGANVVLTSRTEASLAELASEIETTAGVRVGYVPCDLSDPASIAMLGQLALVFGHVDIVINNAVPLESQVAGRSTYDVATSHTL